MRLDRVRLAFRLTAPLFHGGDLKTGSETLFRRLKYFVDGRIEEIPYVSGNELRGQLRRVAMADMLSLAQYGLKNLRLYHALLSGGVLEEFEDSSSPQLDIELRKRVRSLIPHISLFGFAIRNQIFEGKLRVMHALPVCKELRDYLPEDVLERYPANAEKSYYDFLDWTFHTRHAEERRTSEDEQAVQMLYRFEVLIPGTVLYTEIQCDDCTDLELSCLARALNLFLRKGTLGGKSSTGYGQFRAEILESSFEFDDKKCTEHYEKHGEEIRKLLEELDR